MVVLGGGGLLLMSEVPQYCGVKRSHLTVEWRVQHQALSTAHLGE